MRSWLVAFAAAAILSTACGAGTPTTINPTIQLITPTATPPRQMFVSAASDGVQPTDTPTATPIPPTATPEPPTPVPPPPTRVPTPYVAPATKVPEAYAVSGGLRDLICSYSWPCSQAIAVAMCESTMQPGVRNGRYAGLFELDTLNGGHFAHYGYDPDAWADPATNVAVAYLLWLDSGWGPWECGHFG